MPTPVLLPPSVRRRVRALALGALTVATIGTAVLPASPAVGATTAHTRTRAQIPWSRVGSGWTLATWSPSTNPNSTAKVSLYLVGAKGDRYLVTRLSAGSYPVAFSPAAQQALVSSQDGQLADVDLHRGTSHQISIPNLESVFAYTAPAGRSLLVGVDVPQGGGVVSRLERFGAGGRHELSYPLTDRVVGRLDTFGGVQQTPDGKDVVIGGSHGLAVLRNTDGRAVRRLLTRERDCMAMSWWSRGVVLASCNGVLYTAPLSGAATHRISTPSSQNPFGYLTAWRTGASTPPLGLALNGCGPASLVRFDRHGHGIRITVPAPVHGSGQRFVVGHYRDTVTMIFNTGMGCQGGTRTLFSYDALRNRSRALLGTGVNGGTVVGQVPFPTDA